MSGRRGFCCDDSGNVAILFAAGMALCAMLGAVAVDAASLYLDRRHLQTAVDLAAIAAARDPTRAFAVASAVLGEAGVLPQGITVELLSDPVSASRLDVAVGGYRPDPSVTPLERFVVRQTAVNAARVSVKRPGRLFFAQGWGTVPTLAASATAAVEPQVAFSVGSRLASLNGGIANAVLDKLLGTTVSASLFDYRALLNVQVDVLEFLDALGFQVGITAGTYDRLLAADVTHRDIAAALASALTGPASATAAGLAAQLNASNRLRVSDLIQLGEFGRLPFGSSLERTIEVTAGDLLAAGATLGGRRQIALAVSAAVPGLVGLQLDLAVGEPAQRAAWFAFGPASTVTRTAQVRLRLSATVLGGLTLLNLSVRLPLYLELAFAEAKVVSATCPSASAPNGTATLAVRPGVARLVIGDTPLDLTNFDSAVPTSQAAMLTALLLRIRGFAIADVTATSANVSFSSGEIGAAATKSVSTHGLATSLSRSLLDTLALDVDALGFGMSIHGITSAISALVSPLAPVLDAAIDQATETLGVKVGEADVKVYGVTCRHPLLVE